MTIQEMIDRLSEFEDKSNKVFLSVGEEFSSHFKIEDKYEDGRVYIGD